MKKEMSLPPFFGLVRLLAIIGAVLGCIVGGASVLGSLGMFQYGLFIGLTAMLGGAMTILGSLAGLGVAYCLLAIVEATIDTRNTTMGFTTPAPKGIESDWLARKEPSL